MNWLRRLVGLHVHSWNRWTQDRPGNIYQWRECEDCGYVQQKSTLGFW